MQLIDRLIVGLGQREHQRIAVVCLSIVRVDRHRALEVVLSLGIVAGAREHIAEIIVGLGKIRLLAERVTESRFCL